VEEMVKRIVRIVTEKIVREKKNVARSEDTRGLIKYINMCCDLLFDDG